VIPKYLGHFRGPGQILGRFGHGRSSHPRRYYALSPGQTDMRQLDSDLWVAESPMRFFGLELGARMTVIRLAGSRLLVHSPVAATP
jgi:hypothetical protein